METNIANIPIGSYEQGKMYDLKVIAAGSSIVIFVDGEQKYVIEDVVYSSGRPGLHAYQQSFVCDEFRARVD